jgi:amicyanin
MPNTSRRALVAAALGGVCALPLAVLVVPIHAQNAPVPVPMAVGIDNFTFNPQKLTVKAGTTVTWTNMDDIPHAIAAVSKQFKSKTLDTDDAYSFTFTTPGSYEYFCSLHPHMTGTVVVEAAAGENTTR